LINSNNKKNLHHRDENLISISSPRNSNILVKDLIDLDKKSILNEENLNNNNESRIKNMENKKIGIYLRRENFNSKGKNSRENTESIDENSKYSLNTKNICSSKNTIKTDFVKNSTLHSIKERIFWSKTKIKIVRKKLNFARNLIINKEKNEFDQIYGWIENDNKEEFL